MESTRQIQQVRTMLGFANAFLIIEEELTLIDTGIRGSYRRLEELLKKLGRSPGDLKQIVLTHCHFDHVGSVAELKELTGAKVMIHKDDADYLNKSLPYPKPKRRMVSWLYSAMMLPLFNSPPVTADVLLQDGDELSLLGGLKVIHAPGHTPGSICLFSPQRRFLFAGDVLRSQHDYPCLPFETFTMDMNQARKSVARIAELEFDSICFGHGKVITQDVSAKLKDLLEES